MWHTSSGDRTLTGPEADLVRTAINGMAEWITDESCNQTDQIEYGIEAFDELSWSQRLALLEQVARFLLTPTNDTLPLSASNEAAIAAIFEQAFLDIEAEVFDAEAGMDSRKLALAAYRYCFPEDHAEGGDIPADATSGDREQWRVVLEVLTDRILWDRDFELSPDWMDAPPEHANVLRLLTGIDDDYFSTAAPDLQADDDAESVFERLGQH